MKYQYIEDFKKMGFGLFVHFGLYSVVGKGEWYQNAYNVPQTEYDALMSKFNVKKNWAKELVKTAKKAGAKYITLTTRHHDGFSLFDTCGLSDFDAPHSASHRDLVKEFVDECRKEGIKPFFYHTLIDWRHPDFKNDFPKYLEYLRKGIELLCLNYGPVGGFWFDGSWDKTHGEWNLDEIYQTIRKHQPEAMIINNTGLSALGEVSHKKVDAVTFERGKSFKVSSSNRPIAGEVCDGITDHWGYAKNDCCYKSVPSLINELVETRSNGCNLLLNTGLRGDGTLNSIEKYTLLELGKWIKKYSHIVYNCVPADVEVENASIIKDNQYYYALLKNIPMSANENVTRQQNREKVIIHSDKKICNAKYLDSNFQKIEINKKENSFEILPFPYGTSEYIRIVRFKLK